MAAKEKYDALSAYNYNSGQTVKESKPDTKEEKPVHEIKQQADEIRQTYKELEKTGMAKEKKTPTRNGYHMMVNIPEEWEYIVKMVALKEYKGNVTKYINALIDSDLRQRGIIE